MATPNKVILIVLSVIVGLVVILVSIILFSYFTNGVKVEMSDFDSSREVPSDAPQVHKIDSKSFIQHIKKSDKELFIVQMWSTNSTCMNTVDTSMINNILRKNSKIDFMLISYDYNLEDVIKAVKISLYDIGYRRDAYIVDKQFLPLDLEKSNNAVDFLNSITGLKRKEESEYKGYLIFNKNGKLLSEEDWLDEITISKLLQK